MVHQGKVPDVDDAAGLVNSIANDKRRPDHYGQQQSQMPQVLMRISEALRIASQAIHDLAGLKEEMVQVSFFGLNGAEVDELLAISAGQLKPKRSHL